MFPGGGRSDHVSDPPTPVNRIKTLPPFHRLAITAKINHYDSMSKKFFKPIAIGAATALIATTSLLSYAMGLVRDRIIAINFGTTSATDTYNASFLIPDILFNLFIAGALAAAFMPIFNEYLIKDKEEAHKIANTMLNGAIILITTLSLITYILMPEIISTIFQNTEPEAQKDIISMTRLMLFSAVIFAVSNTIGNILMCYKHFLAYAISPILYNLGIIFGVLAFKEEYGIYSAAIGILIGAVLHCIIRIIDIKFTEYKYSLSLDITHPGFKRIVKLMIPRAISLIAWQLNLYIFAIVGIRLIEGGLAAFNFARNIQSFAVSLFGISFATAVFPYLTNSISTDDNKSYTEHIQKTVQRILFFTIPSMIGLMLLARPVVEIILSGGVFDENSVQLTSTILFFFAISIPFESLSHILSRAFYAVKDTITPMCINLISMFIIGFCTLFLAPKYGIEWFSIGFSLGFIFYVLVTTILLKKHLASFSMKSFFLSFGKIIIATGIMAISITVTEPLNFLMNIKIAYIIRITIGATTFFLIAHILKSPEASNINYILERLFKKPLNDK